MSFDFYTCLLILFMAIPQILYIYIACTVCVILQVKNRLDGRYYAIKKIKLAGGSKMMDKLTREVELLSQMNHENIVR